MLRRPLLIIITTLPHPFAPQDHMSFIDKLLGSRHLSPPWSPDSEVQSKQGLENKAKPDKERRPLPRRLPVLGV